MTNLIQSLEESQQSYQQHHASAYTLNAQPSQSHAKPWLKWGGLVILPATLVGLGVSYFQYQNAQQHWLATNVEKVEIVEIPAALMTLSFPDSGPLLTTQREPIAAPEMVKVAKPATRAPIGKTATSAEPTEAESSLLEGIDLAGLSPDIAQRLKAAMIGTNSEPDSIDSKQSEMQDLTSSAAHWHGKLPALNFQTHVYSSNSDKRWVKVNGHEFKEGEWLADGVQLKAIEPQACVIEIGAEQLRVPALYDWQG